MGKILKLYSLPECIVDIIYSYCAPDVQFVSMLQYYSFGSVCSYIQHLCRGNMLTLRKLLHTLSENLAKISPIFVIHSPYYFMSYTDIFREALWRETDANDLLRMQIYTRIYSILDSVMLKINTSDTCSICRTNLYYYMRIIFIEIIKQYQNNLLCRNRSYTV